MKIFSLSVERFRGIKTLEWVLGPENPICLVGAGDSTKSTILEAIEVSLSSRWNMSFSDSDFYRGEIDKPFSIAITVGNLPAQLLKESKFGLHLRGWDQTKKAIHDEPKDGDVLALTIRLRVGSSLEPEWTVITDRTPEGVKISSDDRELIAAVRIDSFVDRHLGWSRGSVLSRLTGKVEEMPGILAHAGRQAKGSLQPDSLTKISAAAKSAETIVKTFGVLPSTGYVPHLDIREMEIRSGGLSLHDGNIPVRQAGLGTRRLVTLSLQHEDKKASARPTLIDEVEHGLEPHRLRRVLRALRPADPKDPAANGQVIITTHSPIAVQEVAGAGINVVCARDGAISIQAVVDQKLQKSIRRYPEAVLARTVVVCEGATEVGFLQALDDWWCSQNSLDAFACLGIVAIDGEGSSATATACRFAKMGFRVAAVLDSDRDIPEADLASAGVHALLWAGKVCTERRIAEDLPWLALMQCVRQAIDNKTTRAVVDSLRSRINRDLPDDPDAWDEKADLRTAIGKSAKANDWFKRIDWGEALGGAVAKHLGSISTSDLASKIEALRVWLTKP
jgi:putative ATP-dependent endonuclease of OLD family